METKTKKSDKQADSKVKMSKKPKEKLVKDPAVKMINPDPVESEAEAKPPFPEDQKVHGGEPQGQAPEENEPKGTAEGGEKSAVKMSNFDPEGDFSPVGDRHSQEVRHSEGEVVELILLRFSGYLPPGSVIKVKADRAEEYISSGKAKRRA